MRIAIKYLKGYPVFQAWNLDDPIQNSDFHDNIISDKEDDRLYNELEKYGSIDVIMEGTYRYLGENPQKSLELLLTNAAEILTINIPDEDTEIEFMTDIYKYD